MPTQPKTRATAKAAPRATPIAERRATPPAESRTATDPPAKLKPDEILARLNEPQREAVSHVRRAAARPRRRGTGKTRVITYRVAYLIATRGAAVADPGRDLHQQGGQRDARADRGLLGAEAAREVDDRHLSRDLRADPAPRRRAPRPRRSFAIYDDGRPDRAGEGAPEAPRARQRSASPPRAVLAAIGQRKDDGGPGDGDRGGGATIRRDRRPRLRSLPGAAAPRRAVDFDDLLMRAVSSSSSTPRSLARYQERCRYDPGRRVPGHQPRPVPLVQPAGRRHRNLCVVGDDDQSIYRWRGADLRNILDFEATSPAPSREARAELPLDADILDAAHAVIRRNAGRHGQDASGPMRGRATAIALFDAYNEYEEAEFVARQIERLTGKGGPRVARHDPHPASRRRGRGAALRRDRRSPTASTPRAACWRRRSSASGSRTSSSAAPASTSGAR